MKKQILLIIAITLIAISSASCSRNATEMANVPDVLKQETINPSDVFALSRNGEVVTIKFLVDLSALKEIVHGCPIITP